MNKHMLYLNYMYRNDKLIWWKRRANDFFFVTKMNHFALFMKNKVIKYIDGMRSSYKSCYREKTIAIEYISRI